MADVKDNINYPINSERRDPFYSKSKGDVGLSKVPNLSFSELNNAILANVNNQVNEGTIYQLNKSVGEETGKKREFPIVKLKPNSSYTNILFGLGQWTGVSEYIGRDVSRLEVMLTNNEAINYNFTVSNNNPDDMGSDKDLKWNVNGLRDGSKNNYPETGYTHIDGRGFYPGQRSDANNSGPIIDKTTYLAKTKLRFRKFKTGGWLISLVCEKPEVDALWVNLTWCRNIDPVNVVDPNPSSTWPNTLFDSSKEFSFYCEKSRVSGNILFESDLEGVITYARSLNHDIPIRLQPNDQNDTYNNNTKTHSITNIRFKDTVNSQPWRKSNSIKETILKSNEIDCKAVQNLPISVNRLNHQIKFRLYGDSLHPRLVETWESANSHATDYQKNTKSLIDTDIDPTQGPIHNAFPISISKLTHDINVSTGTGNYQGSKPEEINNGTAGSGYNSYTMSPSSDPTSVNYATFSSKATGNENHYEYNSTNNSWVQVKDTSLAKTDKVKSLDTNTKADNPLNMVVHGLDHDMLIEVVNKDHRIKRTGTYVRPTESNIATLIKAESNSTAVSNLTQSTNSTETETKKYSYATGLLNLNTFDKTTYQCLDITVHGLDHKIKLRSFRVDVPEVLKDPSKAAETGSGSTNQYRPGSNGKDIIGDIEIDTFTGRVQRIKQEVIDSRYTDCARGLALTSGSGGNFIQWNSDMPTTNLTSTNAPTINGVPFTGNPYQKISDSGDYGSPIVSISGSNSNGRHINIAAYHRGSTKSLAGGHDWQCLNSVPVVSGINKITWSSPTASNSNSGPGLMKLATNNNPGSITGSESTVSEIYTHISAWMNGISGSNDSLHKAHLQNLIKALLGTNGTGGLIGVAGVPKGVIVMWSGYSSGIPSGWELCNSERTVGDVNVPNLSGRFIMGAGSISDINKTGGSSTVTLTTNNLPNHTHTFSKTSMTISGTTKSSGEHKHSIFAHRRGKQNNDEAHVIEFIYDSDKCPNDSHKEADDQHYSTRSSGSHSHSFSGSVDLPSMNSSGGSANPTAIKIEPSYYALAFIIKVK
jgi:hypothetical protein